MNLETLAQEPKLTKITLDRADIVKKYGEAPEFYIHDRQDMETYMLLAKISGDENDLHQLEGITKRLVRNDKGALILGDKKQLPPDLMMAVIEETIKNLGNLVTQTSAS